jgi:hypothetical protein
MKQEAPAWKGNGGRDIVLEGTEGMNGRQVEVATKKKKKKRKKEAPAW